MERKLTQLENCRVQVDVVVDEKSWKDAQEASYKKLAKDVQVDGFRKGNAPEAIARKHIDTGKMLDNAIQARPLNKTTLLSIWVWKHCFRKPFDKRIENEQTGKQRVGGERRPCFPISHWISLCCWKRLPARCG